VLGLEIAALRIDRKAQCPCQPDRVIGGRTFLSIRLDSSLTAPIIPHRPRDAACARPSACLRRAGRRVMAPDAGPASAALYRAQKAAHPSALRLRHEESQSVCLSEAGPAIMCVARSLDLPRCGTQPKTRFERAASGTRLHRGYRDTKARHATFRSLPRGRARW
jgi:hypothetical protein